MKNTTQSLKIITLALILSFGLSYVYAWTAPSATPPTGNVSAPINTSTTAQVKEGSLGVNGLLRGYGNAIVDGNIGIGTTTVPAYYPNSKLSIVGAPAPASGFAGYSGTTNKGFYWPNGYQPEAIFSRETSGVISGQSGQLSYRGGIGLGPGVGIYSVNPNPDGSPLYGDIRFHTSWWDVNNYRNSDRMIIKQDGKVGIGTITPAEKLDVAGNIKASGTICDGSNNCIGGTVRAWVKFSGIGGVVSVANWYNVSSVVRNSAGNYTVNFSTPMPTAHYVAVSSAGPNPNWTYPTAQTASSYTFTVHHPNYGANDSNSIISVIVTE